MKIMSLSSLQYEWSTLSHILIITQYFMVLLQVIYEYKRVLTTDHRFEEAAKDVCKDLIGVSCCTIMNPAQKVPICSCVFLRLCIPETGQTVG